MKLHYSQTLGSLLCCKNCFTTLWNYTTLKRLVAYFVVKIVLLPYEITLLSNFNWNDWTFGYVLLPYEITLLSNHATEILTEHKFYYLMKLHYSQTRVPLLVLYIEFYYLMKLHYSQTIGLGIFVAGAFYYLMKLHYSQTSVCRIGERVSFTTLWNYTTLKHFYTCVQGMFVLLPYKITLLSNGEGGAEICCAVLLPYKITLLSNHLGLMVYTTISFTTLWNYTTLKHFQCFKAV